MGGQEEQKTEKKRRRRRTMGPAIKMKTMKRMVNHSVSAYFKQYVEVA